MKSKTNPAWPVLTRYDQDHLVRVALPLGGIGTGTVSLGGRGDLRDWEIVNRPAKGFKPQYTFFALRAKAAGGEAVARAIEGPVEQQYYEGASGAVAPNHGLPRFRRASFAAAYPLGQVMLSDPDVPVDVRIEGWNPMIPGDADSSGIPLAVLRFVLVNKTAKAVSASVCGNLQNFIGQDGAGGSAKQNRNAFRRDGKLRGLFMCSEGCPPTAEQWGTMALATTAGGGITYRTAWSQGGWSTSLLDYWDDFSDDGRLDERPEADEAAPMASLAVAVRIPPRGSKTVTFLLTWHFPNRRTWTPAKPKAGDEGECRCGEECADPNRVGNWYATQYEDAWDVAARTAPRLPKLEAETLKFVRAFCASDLPVVVKEAALYNVSTLRTQTAFRTEDGRFYGWEGCNDHGGCCHGSCTHVWNYEHATAFLFGDLACRMREVEFAQSVGPEGLMAFRVGLPLSKAREFGKAAADGQMGCLMKLYRDWQLSGDDEMLRTLWPQAKKAIEFCWIPGGWDADRDGVMEGCQHNTMDVEYFGPNPQMEGWYLGALRAAEEMARHLGETAFAGTCRQVFEKGRAWTDAHLFNGQYYEHEIRPPKDASAIAPGLRIGAGAANLADPDFQLGAGCLVDQLVGQFMAHICGLGYLLDPHHVRTTLESILRHNFKETFYGHFNHMRSFVMNDESALLMATYPLGRRPKAPFPYFTEVMTGFEYAAAVGMLQEGLTAKGLKCIKAIRDRYDGKKRNPFDEAECGHHYARAMASWGAVVTLTGFHYSGVKQAMAFAAAKSRKPTQVFWSNGYAWGTMKQRRTSRGIEAELAVLYGSVTLRHLTLEGVGTVEWKSPKTVTAGRKLKGVAGK